MGLEVSSNCADGMSAATYQFPIRLSIVGDITATDTAVVMGVIPANIKVGTVKEAYLSCNNGADSADDLSIELDVLIGGTSIFTTKPKIDKAAGATPETTAVADTGITQGVIDTTKDDVAAGDIITATLTMVRTTPDTEIHDVVVDVIVERNLGDEIESTYA